MVKLLPNAFINFVMKNKKEILGWLFLLIWAIPLIWLGYNIGILKDYVTENVCYNYCIKKYILPYLKNNITGEPIIIINATP